ncbi:hypothetical protein [Gemmatimonas sp.]|uniref:hypothetical protein n=1 Tax=Gemmatimonas sp. TaxID=1962908 RepID=UPI00286E62DC|nr:hypothetical protein [Gemmatimonas sp.]
MRTPKRPVEERQSSSPMLRFLESLGQIEAPKGTAKDHDAVLAESFSSSRSQTK